MKVKRILLALAVGCGGLAVALQQAQPQKYVLINDNKGGFKVYDVESAMTTFAPDGDVEFDASGRPMRGFSKEQGLAFSARRMEGVAERSQSGSYRIRRGSASGAVVIDVVSEDKDGNSASHLECESVTMVEEGDSTTFTLPSTFLFTNRFVSPVLDRFFELRAPRGTFELPVLDRTKGMTIPFKSASVPGPVNVKIVSKRKSEEGEGTQDLTLRADRMSFDGATRTLRLDGNIVYTIVTKPTTGTGLDITFNSTWITIEFKEGGEVGDIKFGTGSGQVKGGGQ